MEISCPDCQQSLTYDGEPPRFCQHCGHSLVSHLNPSLADDGDATVAPTKAPVSSSDPTVVGDVVGPFRLVRWLGAGGMGVVWEAVETATGRRVALKRLSKSMIADENYVQRFVREGRLAAQISNPKVTFIYASGEEDGQPFIAMELMPGKTLADRVQEEGSLPVSQAVDNMLDVVEGLMAAHQLGLIHRDVKPSNCFLDTDESVKIGDFGLSKSLVTNDANLTQTGTFLGTPSYAAPEQIRAGELDERTDIYAVGATLFNLLTGRTPFEGDAMSVTAQIITDDAPPVRELNERVPKDLSRVIAKCLEKDPARRFPDLNQLQLALLPFASDRQSLANIGRRIAGYMIDTLLLQICTGIVLGSVGATIGIRSALGRLPASKMEDRIEPLVFWGGTATWLVTILYFAVCEGCFGRGLGKRMMGLRVVDSVGQRPGFWRGLLRSLTLPGNFGISLIYLAYLKPAIGAASQLLMALRSTVVNLVPMLACVSTMRVRNQFRGLHGYISGTRVTRLETREKRIEVPVVLPRQKQIEMQQFGPYQTNQLMGEFADGHVFLGRDVPLNRDVWIVTCTEGVAPPLQRINLARISRQRWLDGGEHPKFGRWDAYEAIKGVPVQTFTGSNQKADWQDYRQMLLDVALELRRGLKSQTLPSSLTLPQVWIDQNGHAKLLDRQLVNVVSGDGFYAEGPQPEVAVSIDAKATQLFKQFGSLLYRTKVFPVSAQEFLTELSRKEDSESTLDWAIKELESLSGDMGSLAWDSRTGILGVTIGIELALYYLVAGCIFLYCYQVEWIPANRRFFVGVAAGLVLPTVFGYWFYGGPVFKFMGIRVCNSRGRPAWRTTCAIRNAISWFAPVAFIGVFLLLMIIGESSMNQTNVVAGSLQADFQEKPAAALGVLITAGLSLLAISAGIVVALISPQRGVVDLLLGTRLMPK